MGGDHTGSKGKERAPRDSVSPTEYDRVFNPPPNSLDFSRYRSASSPEPHLLAASPELITSNQLDTWADPSWSKTTKSRVTAGIFGNLAFRSGNSPEEDHPPLPTFTSRSTKSSAESLPRFLPAAAVETYDTRTLASILECHHSSIMSSVRSTLEVNMGFLNTRLEGLVAEMRGLRRELEKRGGGGGDELVRDLQRELERERLLRKKQAKDHDAEMENLYAQLSNVL